MNEVMPKDNGTGNRHSVLLVEDDPVLRAKLATVIEASDSLTLTRAVGTVNEAMTLLQLEAPDVLLTDLGLPDGSGADLIRAVSDPKSTTEAMVITVFGDERHVIEALEAGASGYLLKDASEEDIVESILQLLAGGSPISPAIARYLLKRFKPVRSEKPDLPEQLTTREQDILRLIAKGYSAKEIAELESISYNTVTTHVKHIYRKLAVNSRAEAVFEAITLNLVDPD